MALSIDTAVIKGEIDNTTPGIVLVRLWLIGHETPVALKLTGDAWRDVAGRRLTFANPNPKAQKHLPAPPFEQTGAVGDITASRKVKVFTVPEAEWLKAYDERRMAEVPVEWRNSLYLEWFTPENGRCVIESADFEITVSKPAWEMDEAAEQAQQMANMHTMRDYLAAIIQRREPGPGDAADHRIEFSEAEWEEQLRASDRLSDANMEAMDKYGEDESSESKVAFVMGWDHILEDMADAEEGVEPSESDSAEKKQRREWIERMNEAAAEVEEEMASESWKGEAAFMREEREAHPLVRFARDFVVRIIKSMREAGIGSERGEDPDLPLERFISNSMQISGKLAGALGPLRRDASLDAGYVLAITKRCLNWANTALAGLSDVTNDPAYAAHRDLLESYRTDLFKLREGITDLRKELRG